MSARLRIICKAVMIRMNNGEELIYILSSYPALTETEKREVIEYVNSQLFDEKEG